MTCSIWVEPPNDPRGDLASRYGITAPYFDGRWLAKLANPLQYLRSNPSGYPGHIFLCGQGDGWPSPQTMTGAEYGSWAYDMVQKKIAPGTSGDFPRVDLNLETDPAWVMDALRQWRRHSPKRTTAFSPAAHKATLYAPYVAELVAMKITVRPQCYVDTAQGIKRVESANEVLAWIEAGYPASMIEPFLEGRFLGEWWQEHGACVFSQGSLP